MRRRFSQSLIRNVDTPICTIKFNHKIIYELFFPSELKDKYKELHEIRQGLSMQHEEEKLRFMQQASMHLVDLRAAEKFDTVTKVIDNLPTIWRQQKKNQKFDMEDVQETQRLYEAEFACRATRHDAAPPVKNSEDVGIFELEEHISDQKHIHQIFHHQDYYCGFGFEFEFLPGLVRAQANLSLTLEQWAAKLAENVFLIQQLSYDGELRTYYTRLHRTEVTAANQQLLVQSSIKSFCNDLDLEESDIEIGIFKQQQGSPMMSDPQARMIKIESEDTNEARELRNALEQASNSRNSLRIGCQPLLIHDRESIVSPGFTKGGGLFRRGLVLPHRPNPPTRSLSCICDVCENSFRVQTHICGPFSSHFHHDPIGGFLYSESGRFTLLIPPHVPGCPFPADPSLPLEAEDIQKREAFLQSLPPAPDDTAYRIDAGFNCPHCEAPYIDYKKYPGERAGEMYALSLFEHPEAVLFYHEDGIQPIDEFHYRV